MLGKKKTDPDSDILMVSSSFTSTTLPNLSSSRSIIVLVLVSASIATIIIASQPPLRLLRSRKRKLPILYREGKIRKNKREIKGLIIGILISKMEKNSTLITSSGTSSVKVIKYAKLGCQYLVNHILAVLLISLIVGLGLGLGLAVEGPVEISTAALRSLPEKVNLLQVFSSLFFIIFFATMYLMSKPRTIYLVDYVCFKPPETCRMPFATLVEHCMVFLKPKSAQFMLRIAERSGLGDETCQPPENHYIPPIPTIDRARSEAEMVIFSSIDKLLTNTGAKPKDIDVLILNCSVFCPTSSLTAMIVNKYKMRSNIRSFNLSGMGCSTNPIAVNLARDVLQVHPNSYALVVSTEILTNNHYKGDERAMLLPNCLFRMGCVAILLSNKGKDRRTAKYKLLHAVRTHKGSDDNAFKCVHQMEDSEGNVGIFLSKDLMKIAGEALKSNITTIGPLVLPASEQLRFLFSLVARKLFNLKWKPYIPDFKKAFDHFCIHAGGRAVIDELQKNLDLSNEHIEASRMTLHRFGNTSSSSLWYEMAYIEAKGRMKIGNRVWQIAFGSGFKCNSTVWKCNRDIKPTSDGPWACCIDRYPVDIPDIMKL